MTCHIYGRNISGSGQSESRLGQSDTGSATLDINIIYIRMWRVTAILEIYPDPVNLSLDPENKYIVY